jgi:hypothetical protein
MRWRLIFGVLVMAVACLGRAQAGDARGRYIILGVGGRSCRTFVTERSRNNDVNYLMWLAGYLTRYNAATIGAYDILGDTEIDKAMMWLENYCKEHPYQPFDGAAAALVQKWTHPDDVTPP